MKAILFLAMLPTVVVSWLIVGISLLFRITHRYRFEGFLVLTAEARSERRFSVTLGRSIIYAPGHSNDTAAVDNEVERHEHVHVRQAEDEAVKGLVVGVAVALLSGLWWLGAGVWAAFPALLVVHNVTGAMRYGLKGIYRDAEHERSAYAQTDTEHTAGPSWTVLRDLARRDQ